MRLPDQDRDILNIHGPGVLLLTKVRNFITEQGLFNEGDRVVVAVSGGADSVALLDILVSLAELRLDLVVAHLNHRLRGTESDEDEAFVRRLAARHALRVEIWTEDVKELGRKNKLSLEEAGRLARYDFFSGLAQKYGAQAIALAHHADDQAETVLMRLLRGSGATGLCAISPKSGGNLVRPLLAVTRREIEEYLHRRSLSYRSDSTNADTTFLRNRVRHELLPCLETFNPNVRERLVATAEALARDEEVLERVTDDAFARHGEVRDGVVTLEATGCRNEPAGVRLRLYRRAILLARGGLERIGSVHLRDIDMMVSARKPHMVLSLPDRLRVAKSYNTVAFSKAPDEPPSPPGETMVAGPGAYVLAGGYCLTVEEGPLPETWQDIPAHAACFDADAAPFPWLARTFREGDRLVPLGMAGHKKVKDLFIDEKVSRDDRQRIPLIFSGGKLLWVGSLRVSDEARVTETTCRIMRVRLIDMHFLMDL